MGLPGRECASSQGGTTGVLATGLAPNQVFSCGGDSTFQVGKLFLGGKRFRLEKWAPRPTFGFFWGGLGSREYREGGAVAGGPGAGGGGGGGGGGGRAAGPICPWGRAYLLGTRTGAFPGPGGP